MKIKHLLFLLLLPATTFCQDISVGVTPNPLVGRKYAGEKLIVQIDVELKLTPNSVPSNGGLTIPFSASLAYRDVPTNLQLVNDSARIVLQWTPAAVTFDSGVASKSARVSIIIPAGVVIDVNKAMTLQIYLSNSLVAQKMINIEPANDVIYSADQYVNSPTVVLDEVVKVESTNNLLTISGFRNGGFTKRQVLLRKNQVLAIHDWSYMFGSGYLSSSPLSLVTVPFKIRPRAEVTLNKNSAPVDTTFSASAMSGITNIGVNIDIFKWTLDRYFSSGKKSTHKFGGGVIITPGVEELGATVVKDNSLTGDKKSKQFYVSIGLSGFYSYNGITFFIVPAAIDWAPSSIGKQWIYNKKYWWGFGIGINPTTISQLFNKP
ncbi:hypothetical protein [Paraflavitalea pollutisoli]|uniref:hypothetical protein n=1 Tax=Paraflavitalea pollutisoli TaxID=3034143 RepID=UPI0023EAC2BB|nr:hypothetical protein [Paraflavitalea sp. H1-2-19X]